MGRIKQDEADSEMEISSKGRFYIVLTILIGFLVGFFWVYYPVYEELQGSRLVTPAADASVSIAAKLEETGFNGAHARREGMTNRSEDLIVLTDLRLEREKERSRLQERLEELLSTADEENSKVIHDKLLELAKKSSMEREIENLLKARGCREVVVVAHDHSISVVIKGVSLDAAAVSIIGELVAEVTGYPLGRIRIIE